MAVCRCICRRVTFRFMLDKAKELGLLSELGQDDAGVFARLQEETGIGTGCGACVPYARVALRTGKSSLPVMRVTELERILGPSGVEVTPLSHR
ncbi:MAG: hypothetical protein U0637_12570 [Phycisphaerales bacterium]